MAHALCRERKDLNGAAVTRDTDIAIDVLARHTPPSNAQRYGVRLARRIIRETSKGRRAPAKLNGDGPRRPALTDYIIAVTGNEPFTCTALIDKLRPYLTLNTDRIAAAHRIHVAVNRDPRFRRHEHGIYTRIHHDPDPDEPGARRSTTP